MSDTKTIRAVKKSILIGDINVDVFQMPDGDYRYGYNFIANLIEKDKSVLSDKRGIYYIGKLIESQCYGQNVFLDDIRLPYVSISSQDLNKALGNLAVLGCQPAIALMVACMAEALETRANQAFNVAQPSIETRNTKIVYILEEVSRSQRIAPFDA